jgi:CspA family cold shock protein
MQLPGCNKDGHQEDEAMHATGRVKWFNDLKGFGFAIPDDGGEEVFVHHREIVTEGVTGLREGERIEYETVRGPRGIEATKVRCLER